MRKAALFAVIGSLVVAGTAAGQAWPYGDHWYENPLGFDPLELHAFNGFLVPALAVGFCLILTKPGDMPADRITLHNESGVSWGYKYPYTTLFQNNTGVQVFLRKWLAVGVDLGLYVPRDAFNDTAGIAIRPYARFYPVRTDRLGVYFESGGGLICFFRQFPKPTERDPRLGTYWNGTTRYGLGAEVKIGNAAAVLFGIRHVHVSNGNVKGLERNPSHDSNGFFVGWAWRL